MPISSTHRARQSMRCSLSSGSPSACDPSCHVSISWVCRCRRASTACTLACSLRHTRWRSSQIRPGSSGAQAPLATTAASTFVLAIACRLGSALQQKLKHSPWNSSAALPHYDMKRRSYPAAYYQVVIQYLIDILRVMRGRQPGFYLLRCSLVLIQARLTPLVHAALPFHEQAMKIVRTLDFSQGRSATSGEAASADSGVRSPQHGDARTCMYPIGCS